YRAGSDGTWELTSTLQLPGAAESGHSLSPSIAATDQGILIGAGDPDAVQGAFAFRYGAGDWNPVGPLAFRTPPPAPASGAVDFAGILRILQPPPRFVAVDGPVAAVSGPASGAGGPRMVKVYRQDGSGWAPDGEIAAPEGNTDQAFASALGVAGDEILVGSPGHGEGIVYRFGRAGTAWATRGELTAEPRMADSTATPERFGTSLAVDGDRILIGAPGASNRAGAAYLFESSGDGAPTIIEAPAPAEGHGFGAAVALQDVGAVIGAPGPGPGGAGGAVYLFSEGSGGWSAPAGGPALTSDGAGAALGAAVALGDGVVVAGAPGLDGSGAATVLTVTETMEVVAEQELFAASSMQAHLGGEARCAEGDAGGFNCDGVDLVAFVPVDWLGGGPGERVSDVWGWTDPETGGEYALVGRSGGAAIVDVTDASSPVLMGTVGANPSGARDLKVYSDHLFFTGDGAGNHGLVVFDLTHLREPGPYPKDFEPDAVYDGIASAHNLVMDTESGFAYPVGASGGGETCGGGLHAVDVRDPKNPTFAGCFTDTEGLIYQGRTHDAQCTVYQGPDEDFNGRQLCFSSNETALRIIDMTDKANPTPIGTATYPGLAYVHQGWLTDDHRYYYLNDELDELVGTTDRTRTYVFDVAELDDPILVGSVDGPNRSTDHNLYVKGDRMYQANYQAGFRLFDISDPEAPEEIGWFDTTPYDGDPPGFVGAWTAYPYLESGTLLVTSMNEGLFLLRAQPRALIP
ncbi:MAG: choice-of-anchor B family protein, partial [Gemmatimonadetes bacterium]|nr:choice-of-anchor B family protein [Gemmatimonadota bacterium]